MKYYTAKELCDTFPHIAPADEWLLRRMVKAGKFPIHDCMVKRGNREYQAWGEHTILNWRTIVASKS